MAVVPVAVGMAVALVPLDVAKEIDADTGAQVQLALVLEVRLSREDVGAVQFEEGDEPLRKEWVGQGHIAEQGLFALFTFARLLELCLVTELSQDLDGPEVLADAEERRQGSPFAGAVFV
jgi:hypothetical protein